MIKKIAEFKSNAFSTIKNVFVDPAKRKNVIIYTFITALISVLFSSFGAPQEKVTDFYMSIFIPTLLVCFVAFVITEAINASLLYMQSAIILILMGIALQLRLFKFEDKHLSFFTFDHLKLLIIAFSLALIIVPFLILFVRLADKQCEIGIPKANGETVTVTFSVKKALLALLILAIVAFYVILLVFGYEKNGAITSVRLFGVSFQIPEITKILSIIGFTFAYTLPRDEERIFKRSKLISKLPDSIVAKINKESGFIISFLILAINGLCLFVAKELGTLLIIGIMFCIQTVLHHPKAVKRLLPFILIAAIAVTAVLGYVNNHYEAVETYNAYLEEVEKSDSPGDLEEPPKPGDIDSKLKRVHDWSLNIKLLFDVEEAVENAEAKEDNSTQQSSAMEAMMLGGLFGNEYVTTYESSDKIQEINNDMAFSYLTLKLGILNALILIALFIIMFVIATKECLKNPSLTTASIGISFAAMLSVQSLVSAMSAIGFLPVIGVQLPFIGSGGAYLLISFVVLFFIIYATSGLHKNDVATEPEETTENTKEETNNVCTD